MHGQGSGTVVPVLHFFWPAFGVFAGLVNIPIGLLYLVLSQIVHHARKYLPLCSTRQFSNFKSRSIEPPNIDIPATAKLLTKNVGELLATPGKAAEAIGG